MKLKLLAAALLAATMVTGASAARPTIYDSASFETVDDSGSIVLSGFGRSVSKLAVTAASFAASASRVNFFDTWNIDVSDIAPGTYSFENWLIDARGSLRFGTDGFSVSLSYIDEFGGRFTELFDVNAEGTQAAGSGTFTVREQCPILSCVWLDITGTQEVGGAAGYGGAGSLVASVVPEPASWGLMALGLLAVGAAARRRRVDA
jgi:PEP-CTERM motif